MQILLGRGGVLPSSSTPSQLQINGVSIFIPLIFLVLFILFSSPRLCVPGPTTAPLEHMLND